MSEANMNLLRSAAANGLEVWAAAIVAIAGEYAWLALERAFLDPVAPIDPPPDDLTDLMLVSTALFDPVTRATNSPDDDSPVDDIVGSAVDVADIDAVQQLIREALVDLRSLVQQHDDAARAVFGALGSRHRGSDRDPSWADTIDSLIGLLYDHPRDASRTW